MMTSRALLFDGHYSFRSWRAIVGVIACGLFGLATTYIALAQDWKDWTSALIIVPFALGFDACAIYLTWGIVTDRKILIRISEEGICSGSRLVPWDKVAQFGGVIYRGDSGVLLYAIHRNRYFNLMIITPSLTPMQYEKLAAQITTSISTRYPHVDVLRAAVESPRR